MPWVWPKNPQKQNRGKLPHSYSGLWFLMLLCVCVWVLFVKEEVLQIHCIVNVILRHFFFLRVTVNCSNLRMICCDITATAIGKYRWQIESIKIFSDNCAWLTSPWGLSLTSSVYFLYSLSFWFWLFSSVKSDVSLCLHAIIPTLKTERDIKH